MIFVTFFLLGTHFLLSLETGYFEKEIFQQTFF